MLPALRRSLLRASQTRLGHPFPSTYHLQPAGGATSSTASTINAGLELGEPFCSCRSLCFCANVTAEIKPHNYTSGRWLRRDKLEIDSRYIQFNFGALCQKVIELCPGASHIQNCRKIEGGFNRVFIFTLDSSKTIVARLPFRLAGPAKLTTISEVATVRYCQFIVIPLILTQTLTKLCLKYKRRRTSPYQRFLTTMTTPVIKQMPSAANT